VFDALEKIGGGNIDWRQKRVRIEHGDGVSGDLIERAKRLGVVVVQNPTHFALVDIIYESGVGPGELLDRLLVSLSAMGSRAA
jgi:predicted amidohydrolase YtcJ